MGGGILPAAYHRGQWHFLFSRETKDVHGRASGSWSDFGGARENEETNYQTAVREGWEESSGILGTKKQVKRLVKDHLLGKVETRYYTTYVVRVAYDSALPARFSRQYREIKRENPELIQQHNGLYEKDRVRWIQRDRIRKSRSSFRPWYRSILDIIIAKFENKGP